MNRCLLIGGTQRLQALSIGLLCLFSISCTPKSPQPQDQKEVIPITGEIRLDGEPGHGVMVTLTPKSDADAMNPTFSKGRVDEEGRLIVGTYNTDDGVPPGDYILTFVKFDTSRIVIGQKPADLLKGKYFDPETSELTISVPSGEDSVDIGTIELTSPE